MSTRYINTLTSESFFKSENILLLFVKNCYIVGCHVCTRREECRKIPKSTQNSYDRVAFGTCCT